MLRSAVAVLASLSLAITSAGAPVGLTFVSGQISSGGFPTPSTSLPTSFTPKKISGGGSTGGGFASVQLIILDTDTESVLRVTGSASHGSSLGLTSTGSSNITIDLPVAATVTFANDSSTVGRDDGVRVPINAVRLIAGTGSISTGSAPERRLTPGTYRIQFSIGAGPDFSYDGVFGCNSTVVDWQLTLRKRCVGDMNADSVVDDSDFQAFIFGYNTLVCSSSEMPPDCPADLNNDGFVDDADFQMFVVSYNELICP